MSVIKYIKLSEKLEKFIRENGISGRLPGLYKLARELNVNHVTLYKAIHHLAQQGKLEIVPWKGTYVVGENMVRRKYHAIGVLGYCYSAESAKMLFDELNRELASTCYKILRIETNCTLLQENPRLLLNYPVDGFVFLGSSITRGMLDVLQENTIPAICTVNENYPEQNQIGMDHVEGYGRDVSMLMEKGYRKIAFLSVDRSPSFQNYIDDIRNVFADKLGKNFDPGYFRVLDSEDFFRKYGDDYLTKMAEHAIALWKDNPPDAIISFEQVLCRLNEKFPQTTTVSFNSMEPISGVDYYFCEDIKGILELAIKRMFQIFKGDTTITRQFVKFINKKYNIYIKQEDSK